MWGHTPSIAPFQRKDVVNQCLEFAVGVVTVNLTHGQQRQSDHGHGHKQGFPRSRSRVAGKHVRLIVTQAQHLPARARTTLTRNGFDGVQFSVALRPQKP